MTLSLTELRHAAQALGAREGARLEKVVQDDAHAAVLVLSGGGEHAARERLVLRLSAAPKGARVSALERTPKAPPEPPAFAAWLRAHAVGARLAASEVTGEERQLALRFEGAETATLLLSILGPRSNVYALDAEGRVRASLRPLGETRRDLSLGAPWSDPEGKPRGPGEDRFEEAEGEAYLHAIETHYAEAEAEGEREALARRIRQAIKRQGDSIRRKEKALRSDLATSEKADQWRQQGELLKSVLREVRPGAEQVTAHDFETGEPVEIALDPKLDAKGNMERLFKKHRKAERAGERAVRELGVVEERREKNEALQAAYEEALAAEDEAALEAFAERPEVASLLGRFTPGKRAAEPDKKAKKSWKLGKRELPTRLVPKRYRTADGLEVWVGKNDDGNDVLTTRLARGKDLFLHLEASPGSHVVLRTEGGEPPQASLLDAAELAVHFSKQRNAGRASVHIAAIKDVSKPKGAKPGLVYVHRGRTLNLRREPERLRRILDARIED